MEKASRVAGVHYSSVEEKVARKEEQTNKTAPMVKIERVNNNSQAY